MNIFVPPISSNGKIIRSEKVYEVESWVNAQVDSKLDPKRPQNGFEGEGFVIDEKGGVMTFHDTQFKSIEQIEDIQTICEQQSSEDNLNNEIQESSNGGLFTQGIARISQELYLPCIEFSFDRGFGMDDLFHNIIGAYGEIDRYLSKKGLLYLPNGNMPVATKNFPNLGNEYYKYLFETRDGYDIAYFRGAGLQLHKEMDNYKLSVYIYNKIRHILPVFLVLSQNSPFADGEFRGNLSERISTKCDWKMTGIPESIDDNFLHDLQRWLQSTIKSVTPYYFAVRYPRVDIHTIENCAMDTISDIPLMCALIDLYYRLTEKLKITFITGASLPHNIFGDDDGSNIETNVIRENYHRSIRYGTDTEYAILGNGTIGFKEYMENLCRFVDDIPSTFPDFVSQTFGYSKTDATQEIISHIVSHGNLAEQTLREFGIAKKMPMNPVAINEKKLREHMVNTARKFSQQVTSILNHPSYEKSLNNRSL